MKTVMVVLSVFGVHVYMHVVHRCTDVVEVTDFTLDLRTHCHATILQECVYEDLVSVPFQCVQSCVYNLGISMVV